MSRLYYLSRSKIGVLIFLGQTYLFDKYSRVTLATILKLRFICVLRVDLKMHKITIIRVFDC